MVYNPDKHHRRSTRLKGYDYSQPGVYFVTICIQRRECLLGHIQDAAMVLNDVGTMVARWWAEIHHKFPTVELDEFVVMPNHFHGIVVVVEPDPVGADLRFRPGLGTHAGGDAHAGVSLPTVVQWFKTMTTNEYIRGIKQYGWRPFSGKLWQRNYYERITRNEIVWDIVRKYIINNPINWKNDEEFEEFAR